MAETVLTFLQSVTSSKELIVLLVSMIPLIELKGAIPIGEGLSLSLAASAGLAYLGSTLIIVPIYFLLQPIFALLKKIPLIKRFVEKLETMLKSKAAKMAKKRGGDTEKETKRLLMTGLTVFVSIPVPLTGVWTGAALGVFMGLKFKEAILPLALGNLIAGSLITLITFLFREYVDYIILGIFAIAIIMLVVTIVKVAFTKTEGGGA